MKRLVLWIATTVTVLVLLFAYHTSTNREAEGTTLSGPATTGTSGTSTSTHTSTPSHRSSPSSKPSRSSKPSGTTKTSASSKPSTSSSTTQHSYLGSVVQTPRGPVQVKITVAGSKITKVSVPVHPDAEQRSIEIDSYAVPQLIQETMSAQSGHVDMVSGATLTSQGYQQSLQSALDQAGIK